MSQNSPVPDPSARREGVIEKETGLLEILVSQAFSANLLLPSCLSSGISEHWDLGEMC